MAIPFIPAIHSALIHFLWRPGFRAAWADEGDASRSLPWCHQEHPCATLHWHSRESALEGRKGNLGLVFFLLTDGIWNDSVDCPWNEHSEMSFFGSFSVHNPKLFENWPLCRYPAWHHKFPFPWPTALVSPSPSASLLSHLSLHFSHTHQQPLLAWFSIVPTRVLSVILKPIKVLRWCIGLSKKCIFHFMGKFWSLI